MSKVDSLHVPVFEPDGPDYDVDYCAWLEEQGRRLRLLRIPGLDTEMIAEEIEGLSRSDKREVRARMAVLLAHLLKWRYQPDRSGRSWQLTLTVQRQAIADLIEESPSLRPTLAQALQRAYPAAVLDAAAETGLPEDRFPASCEWTVEQVLTPAFLPTPA